jgi:hypothetical protein
MSERWFSEDELRELSRPTMDRAIEALDAGDIDGARALCEGMKYEWLMLHDLYAKGTAGLLTFIKSRLGEAAIGEAHEESMAGHWQETVEKVAELDRRRVVELLAGTWRAHSTSGVGPNPGAFTIVEDDEKVTFSMNPCGSGQRLWRNGHYAGENAFAVTDEAHDWSYGRKGFPIYCTHCTFMNELLPIRWLGFPIYPSHAPDDFDHDPCVWHWYKDPAAIPAEHWERHGLAKPAS